VRVFGTIYPFIETDETSLKYGRHVANFDFLKYLLLKSSFDEYHLFCLNVNHFNMTKKILLKELDTNKQKEKIRLFLYNHLIDQIKSREYFVFHLGGWGYFFPGLVYLRNTYAKNKFPITGIIHSLNGIETKYHALKICTAPVLPYDTIICSSRAGERVIQKIFKDIESDFIRANNKNIYNGKTEIIPLGFDHNYLNPAEKQECRQQLDIPINSIVLLTLNRFSPHTKADLFPLIKTFQRLIAGINDVPIHIIMAGAGREHEICFVKQVLSECGLQNHVRIISNFENKIKPCLYGAADVYISVSDNLQETFGISVIEAMASGLPVVVSDINGYSELVSHSINGFKIPSIWIDEFKLAELADIMDFNSMQLFFAQCMAIDTEKLYEHLFLLITDKMVRSKIGANAKESVSNRYCWSKVIKTYEDLWQRLFNQSCTYSGTVDSSTNPFLNNYLKIFDHYPTTVIQNHHLCRITQEGEKVLLRGIIPLAFSDIGSILDNETILKILHCLGRKPMTIFEIISLKTFHKEKDNIKYIILWMAKYSLIQIIFNTELS
jgi:glycosyltransferase involved in cell wall biosynthesis